MDGKGGETHDKNEKNRMGETENQLVLIAAGFLGKQMEQ